MNSNGCEVNLETASRIAKSIHVYCPLCSRIQPDPACLDFSGRFFTRLCSVVHATAEEAEKMSERSSVKADRVAAA